MSFTHEHAPVTAPSPFPRKAPLVVGAVLLATLVGVGAVRWSGDDIRAPDASAATVRQLRFEDRPDGSVAVIDGRSGLLVRKVEGEAGFLRGTMRGLARERRRAGLGNEQPFELIGRADGRLTLHDPATGVKVDLESFGPVNAAVFAQFLSQGRTDSDQP